MTAPDVVLTAEEAARIHNVDQRDGRKREAPQAYYLPWEVVDEELAKTRGLRKMVFPRNQDDPFVFELVDGEPIISLRVGDEAYIMSNDAYELAGRSVGCSKAFLDRNPKLLVLPILNFWFSSTHVDDLNLDGIPQSADDKRKGPFGVLVRDNALVGFAKSNFEPLDNDVVVEMVKETYGDVLVDRIFNTTDLTIMSFIGSEDTAKEVAVGDILREGMVFHNSLTGAKPVMLDSYVYRLRCLNGLIGPDKVWSWSKRSDTDSAYAGLEKGIAQARFMSRELMSDFAKLQEQEIDGSNIGPVLGGIMHEMGMPAAIQEEVRARAARTDINTMYDLVNLLTWVASNSRVLNQTEPVKQRQMMRGAGQLVKDPAICESCHRPGAHTH